MVPVGIWKQCMVWCVYIGQNSLIHFRVQCNITFSPEENRAACTYWSSIIPRCRVTLLTVFIIEEKQIYCRIFLNRRYRYKSLFILLAYTTNIVLESIWPWKIIQMAVCSKHLYFVKNLITHDTVFRTLFHRYWICPYRKCSITFLSSL